MPQLPLIPGDLGYTCYPPNVQTLVNDAFSKGVALLTSSLTGVVLSDTEPPPLDRDKVWARTSAGAPTTPFLWIFWLGQWLAKHPIPSGTLWALPYTGSVASIATLDGGAAGAVSDNSGPFWEAVATLAGRVPIGAGTLPSGAVLAVGDTGGEDKHTLLQAELPLLSLYPDPFAGTQFPAGGGAISGGGVDLNQIKPFPTQTDIGQDQPFNVLPPYVAITFLRRTSRIYATQPIA